MNFKKLIFQNLHLKITICFYLFFLFTTVLFSNEDKINVLMLSGQNNHNWEKTTPEIKRILEESNKFNVKVCYEPEKLNPNKLLNYDVIMSNWNTWPDVTGQRWNKTLEKSFLDFISKGKGFVVIHAGSSTLQDWPEFQKIAGGTWGKDITGHGPIHTFKVKIDDRDSEITKNLHDFYIKDELWHRTQFQKKINVLCKAYSNPEKKGTGNFEPIVIQTEYGKGRCFYNVLGHNKATMQNNAWKTLLLRGTEWAATNKVSIKPLFPWPTSKRMAEEQSKYYEQTDSTIALYYGKNVVWQYNFTKVGKPYFHPISNSKGNQLTLLAPEDHPWHYGLWFSWKYINKINYWEEDRITKLAEGITEVINSGIKLNSDNSAEIKQKLCYHPQNGKVILNEDRKIYVSSLDSAGEYYIDWESKFSANNERVVLGRTPIEGEENGREWGGYATLGLRINSEVLSNVKLLNDNGKIGIEIHQTPTKWTDISGYLDNKNSNSVGVTIFDNNNNPRYPVCGYVINSPIEKNNSRFIYTNPGFLYNSEYIIEPHKELILRYRIYIHNGIGEENKINKLYENYILKSCN